MRITKKQLSDTQIQLTFTADQADLGPIKQKAIQQLGKNLKLPGFRDGKAPVAVLEKNLDESLLQTEVIEQAVNEFYVQALDEHKIRPVARPDVSIKKFVPFTELEFETVISVIGEIKLADYTKIKLKRDKANVTAKDIDEVLQTLASRAADRKTVKRAAKSGDQVTIDFKGTDEKGAAINGAEGKAYPLVLGSNAFIPGFEDKLIGKEAGKLFSFNITFPKEYGVKALASKKVKFEVTITQVDELVEPKIDDAFAAKVGPFKSLDDLKKDIKTQLTAERQNTIDRDYEQALIEQIVAKSKVNVPTALVEEQIEAMVREQKQNIVYRGQTWQEFLDAEQETEESYREKTVKPLAEMRVQAGLVLAEIADKEGVKVSPDEVSVRVQLLKGQYQDPAMQAELDKPENQRDIGGRMITEKTIEKLVALAEK